MSIVSKALKKAGGQVSNAWNDTTGAAQDAADLAANEAKKLGKRLLNGLEDLDDELQQIFDLNVIGIRDLRIHEREVLQRMYGSSLPRMNNLLIVSLTGASGRPFTLPASENKEGDPYYPYIKSNVRPGRPYAVTDFT
jgi:hypothetical protein